MKTPTPIPSCPLLSLENSISLFLFSRLFFFFLSRRCFHFVEVDSVAFFPPRDGNPSPSLAQTANCIVSCLVLQRFSTSAHAGWTRSAASCSQLASLLLAVFMYCSRAAVEAIISRNLYFSEYFEYINIERKCKYKVSRICL